MNMYGKMKTGAWLIFILMVFHCNAIAGGPDTNQKQQYQTLDSLFSLYQPYLGNISAYEPMYFLIGADPKESSFQISFKYNFIDPEGSLARKFQWTKGFHFAYTQTSFWDLKSSSQPFDDTSYKPELFFLTSNIHTGISAFKGVFVQAGIRHESNGRGGELSRSFNSLYFKPISILFNEKDRIGFLVAPLFRAFVSRDKETNPDVDDYRGHVELEMKLGQADSLVLGSKLGWAREGGSIQVDLTYPLHKYLFQNLDIYLHLQYSSMLAERLIDYKQRSEAFRIGFSIVR